MGAPAWCALLYHCVPTILSIVLSVVADVCAQYMNDPKVLGKLGSRLGDVSAMAAAAAGTGAPPAAPAAAAAAGAMSEEVDNLWDAARVGDLEAVEDFLAIGKVTTDRAAGGGIKRHWRAERGVMTRARERGVMTRAQERGVMTRARERGVMTRARERPRRLWQLLLKPPKPPADVLHMDGGCCSPRAARGGGAALNTAGCERCRR